MEGPFNDPDIPDGERTAYRGRVGGDEVATAEVLVERSGEGDRAFYRQSVVAHVGGRLEVRAETTFRRRSGSIHAESHEMSTLDRDAAPVAVESARFRGVKVLQWGAGLEPYPRDLTPLVGCVTALRGLDFEAGARRGFSVWLASSVYWTAEARVKRLERIDLPAGKMRAWRVPVRPNFEEIDRALDGLIQTLVPPVVFHFAAGPPHRLLRAEFPSGPFRWNPPGVIEATELGSGRA
jgi:hypothetical protein